MKRTAKGKQKFNSKGTGPWEGGNVFLLKEGHLKIGFEKGQKHRRRGSGGNGDDGGGDV
jgi:hypothetical protein